MGTPLCIADQGSDAFEAARRQIDVVCLGDSLTGWNNYGPRSGWPWPTYPEFLAELCEPFGLRLANAGVAGEVSGNGPRQVDQTLALFPNARWFIFGMGTNDLTAWPDAEGTSREVLANLERMARAVVAHGRQPVLFNVPKVKESLLSPRRAEKVRLRHSNHNERLREFCEKERIPLADIFAPLDDEHFADTLHPNAAGARLIAGEVYRALRSVCGPLR